MKKFIATATAIAASLIATPSFADQQVHNDHVLIVENLSKVGVTVVINNPIHCPSSNAGGGSYYPGNAMLIICQNNGLSDGMVVDWTSNDYNTLRHEAHHVIQDCVEGELGDNRMRMLFEGEDFLEFTKGLDKVVDYIYNDQRKMGNSGDHAMEEVEAYIVAEYIDAPSIADKVIEFCVN
jgi:hypothetical protein